ncbi:MAG: HAMP domain-containing sensor histidine kinase [Bacteroidota bacterium]
MNGLKYKSVLYFISLVILATLCIQVYWNYKNYKVGKQQLIADVQTSLDNALDQYFTRIAKDDSYEFFTTDSLLVGHRSAKNAYIFSDSIFPEGFEEIKIDTLSNNITVLKSSSWSDSLDLKLEISDSLLKGRLKNIPFDLNRNNPITELSTKIMISFSEDQLSLPKIDSLFSAELQRKNLPVSYGLTYDQFRRPEDSLRPEITKKATLKASTISPYFLHENIVKAHFTNVTLAVLKRNLVGILLSFLLVGSVILCLLYLLRIIKHQKQLAEVKNDLISNITHEFKTPIATIGIAMEAIQNFNAENDTEKNLRYAKISSEQVDKLNLMVEKLLETATLDSEKLELNFESRNLVHLLEKASTKEAFSVGDKQITFKASEEEIAYSLDPFHFENAVNNIIDNAIKYGGDTISVVLQKGQNSIEILISDSGNSLSEAHQKQIFEKFYRVPKGNTHDVKGFGIGLYYTRKIIEKHGGTIRLEAKPNTQFIISLPHG